MYRGHQIELIFFGSLKRGRSAFRLRKRSSAVATRGTSFIMGASTSEKRLSMSRRSGTVRKRKEMTSALATVRRMAS
jgi:hypothetical protein